MEYELNVIIGNSPTWNISFKDEAGTAIDITGYTLYLTVKSAECDTDDDAIVAKDIQPEQLSDPTHGIASISIPCAETIRIAPASYYYDIKYKKPDQTVNTALFGKMNFRHTITNRASGPGLPV